MVTFFFVVSLIEIKLQSLFQFFFDDHEIAIFFSSTSFTHCDHKIQYNLSLAVLWDTFNRFELMRNNWNRRQHLKRHGNIRASCVNERKITRILCGFFSISARALALRTSTLLFSQYDNAKFFCLLNKWSRLYFFMEILCSFFSLHRLQPHSKAVLILYL